MANKKLLNFKPVHNAETPPELTLRAPPPTPCVTQKQRPGSVPDMRIADKKEKIRSSRSPTPISPPRLIVGLNRKKSTSEHVICPSNNCSMGPYTSNLLHSVRQRLLNL